MGYEVGDIIVGTVNQVRPYALFLTFDNDIHGLLHISEISDGYVRDIERFGTVGDKIKVKVIEVDAYNSFLRVSYKQIPEEERFSTHDNSVKKIPEFDEADFSSLEEHLPEWISGTLLKARGKKND